MTTFKFKEFLIAVFAFGAMLWLFSTMGSPELGPYKVEEQWGSTVIDIKGCHAGKYSYTCSVLTEGAPKWVSRDFTNWPGDTIQVGDKLGTHYRVGKDVVETWNRRSSTNMMTYRGRCEKKDERCSWPSKHQY